MTHNLSQAQILVRKAVAAGAKVQHPSLPFHMALPLLLSHPPLTTSP